MTVYRYRAVNAAGEVAAGELDAANESEIVDRLRDQGMMPMRVEATDAAGKAQIPSARAPRQRLFASKRVSRDHVLGLTRELATLLRAGLPLDRALEILINLTPHPPLARLLQTIRDD